MPSEILQQNIGEDEIHEAIAFAKHRNKMLGQQKKGKDEPTREALTDEIKKIRIYYERLGLLVKASDVTVGQGLPLQSKNMLRNSRLGNLVLKFNGDSIQAFDSKTGDLVLQDSADDSLFDLLSKKYYRNKKYTQKALQTYAKLVDFGFWFWKDSTK